MSKLPDDRRAVFTDIYKYYEERWDMPDTTEAWTEAAEQLGVISTKHGNTPLVKNLLMACFQTIDDENRALRKAVNG